MQTGTRVDGRRGPVSPQTEKNGRDGEIRTLDLYNPNVALYQAKLRPDDFFPAP